MWRHSSSSARDIARAMAEARAMTEAKLLTVTYNLEAGKERPWPMPTVLSRAGNQRTLYHLLPDLGRDQRGLIEVQFG